MIHLNREDPKVQGLLALLDGPIECLSSLEIDDIEKVEKLPRDLGLLMIHSYSICKNVLEQVPAYCPQILSRLATVISFVPIAYRDKTPYSHELVK
jgi:hypothetical protein